MSVIGNVAAFVFQHRASALALAAAPLAWAALAATRPEPAQLAGGAALVLAGALLRLSAVRRLGKRARVGRAKATFLVLEGPFRWVRNPLYVAALAILGGFGLLVGLGVWALAPVAATWLVYDFVVRHEERALLAAHGEPVARYFARVPRWLARPPVDAKAADVAEAADAAEGARAEPAAPLVPWGEVLRREWRLLLWTPLGLAGAALLAWPPVGHEVARGALAVAAATHLPLPVLVGAAVSVGALGTGLKISHSQRRRARRRAAQAAARAREERSSDQSPAWVPIESCVGERQS